MIPNNGLRGDGHGFAVATLASRGAPQREHCSVVR